MCRESVVDEDDLLREDVAGAVMVAKGWAFFVEPKCAHVSSFSSAYVDAGASLADIYCIHGLDL